MKTRTIDKQWRVLCVAGLTLPLFLSGCVRSHRNSDVVFAPVPPPVSSRPVVRVYPEPAPVVVQTPAPAVGSLRGVSESDLAIADAISSMVRADNSLVTASSVRTVVEDGIVSLQGTVPNESSRIGMEERIKRLPGVRDVRNQLRVDLK